MALSWEIFLTGRARRSAGTSGAPSDAVPSAKRALFAAQARKGAIVARAAAVVTTLCAGLILTGSSAVGQSITAAPVAATTAVIRDVDTLSRGAVDREALIPVPEESAPATVVPPAPIAYYVAGSAYLRAQPSTSAKALTTLAAGTKVLSGGDAADGWQPVTAGSTSGYVKTSLLTTTAPATKVKTVAAAPSSSYAACASGSAVEAGLVAHTILVHRAVCATFPDITAYGGRSGDGSEHASGKALDIMTSGARGAQIAAWLQANFSTMGIVEIIYQQKIWTTQRASEGWRAMSDRGSATANHYDHIHVLVT
jgi:hypothetical protein